MPLSTLSDFYSLELMATGNHDIPCCILGILCYCFLKTVYFWFSSIVGKYITV